MPALHKDTLRTLIADARTDEALVNLIVILAKAPDLRTPYREMIALRGQLGSVESALRLGLIEFQAANRETTRISLAVLSWLDRLPDETSGSKSENATIETTLLRTAEALAADAGWEYDLFFSFSNLDVEAARNFCQVLRGYGLRVFFSADDLRHRAGQNFGDVIESALHGSRDFLLFCSPAAMQSKWVKLEHETFFHQYHLPHPESRRFYIAEGPAFLEALVPVFHRQYQRLSGPEQLLHTLADTWPTLLSQGAAAARMTPEPSIKPASADEHLWKMTTVVHTRQAYEKYITRFPKGNYVEAVQATLDAFDVDDLTWAVASEANTEKALQQYLRSFPDGQHTEAALEQLSVFDLERRAAEQRMEQEKKQLEINAKKRRALETARAVKVAARLERAKEATERSSDPFHDCLILVEGGTFYMGDTFGEGNKNEIAVHQVTVPDFYLGKYPVTQGQWKAIMDNNPSDFTGDDKLPVDSVSWDKAQEFIKKLNEKTGRKYRLPSEAEWEYAAREGGKKIRFGNGKDIADPKEMNFKADPDYKKNYSLVGVYPNRTTPVDQFAPNSLGLYDMSGNVREWCEDDWRDYYHGGPAYANAWVLNPRQIDRVLRGGSWEDMPSYCRSSSRARGLPWNRDNQNGFRLALSLQQVTWPG